MQVRVFQVPISDLGDQIAEVNAFLRGHKILSMDQHLLPSEHGGCWCFCIRYIEGRQPSISVNDAKTIMASNGKKDYREILDPDKFLIFSRLRECRKQVANEQGVAAYVIFTDEELSHLCQLSELTEVSMQTVNGVGSRKMEKYGSRILELYKGNTEGNEENERNEMNERKDITIGL